MWKQVVALSAVAAFLTGCYVLDNVEDALFPPMAPNFFDAPPAPMGPESVVQSRAAIAGQEHGDALGMTVFAPEGEGNGAAVVWVLGLNQRAYYQQSLHEILASHGYTVVVPDTRAYRFVDMDYHNSIIRAAAAAVDALSDGRIGQAIDPARIAVGGFSIGGPLAAFVAAERPAVRAVFAWAPVEPPFWMRFDTEDFLPLVDQPMLLVEGALDTIARPGVWRARLEQYAATSQFDIVPAVLGDAVHFYFQEPNEADLRNPPTPITRAEQMNRAIVATQLWLDFQLNGPSGDS
jgi:dienelactone hydrolase